MKQSGFDRPIKSAVARDEIVYAGFSGAAVITFSLKGLELTDDPEDVPHGHDADIVWEGLGFVPLALAVHFKSDHPSPNRSSAKLPFMKRLARRIERCEAEKRSLCTATRRESSVLEMAAKGLSRLFTSLSIPASLRFRTTGRLAQGADCDLHPFHELIKLVYLVCRAASGVCRSSARCKGGDLCPRRGKHSNFDRQSFVRLLPM
jgi:hypothetical protein